MKKIYIVLVVIIILVGVWWYANSHASISPNKTVTGQTFGTYQYECDEHVTFAMTPASDMSSIHIIPAVAGAYPGDSTFVKDTSTTSTRYTIADGTVLTAKGETITLTKGDSAISCSPVANSAEAPFNFGD